MRKFLLASSAIVALTGVSNAAVAQMVTASQADMLMAHNDFQFDVNGYLSYGIFFGTAKDTTGATVTSDPVSFATDGNELQFSLTKTMDSGISVGAQADVRIDNGNTYTDEVWMYVRGGFGEVRIGAEDPVSDTMGVGASSRAIFDNNPYGVVNASSETDIDAFNEWEAAVSGDAYKIIYKSPRFAGVQMGASYTPDINEGLLGAGRGFGGRSAKDSAAISAAVNYSADFGDVTLDIGLGYETAKVAGPTLAAPRVNHNETAFGVTVGFLEHGVADVAYRIGDKQDLFKDTVWAVGAGYGIGDIDFGARYIQKKVDYLNTANADVTRSDITVYTNYAITDGFSVGAIIKSDTYKPDGGTSVTGTGFGLTTSMWF